MSGAGSSGPDGLELPREPESVERALASLERPTARPVFRAELKRRFVERAPAPRSDAELELLVRSWRVPAARREFHARLRGAFLAAPPALSRARRGEREKSHPPAPAGRRRVLRPWLIAAAAAVLIAVPLLRTGSTAPTWRAVELQQEVFAEVDGRAISLANAGELTRVFNRGGCSMTLPECTTWFMRSDGLLIRYDSASAVRLAEPIDEEGREVLVIELKGGALGASMGGGFTGVLRILTPRGRIELRGRAVAVEWLENGICICCREGQIRICLPDGSEMLIESGNTGFLPHDSDEVGTLDYVAHAESLEALHQTAERYVAY